MTGSAERHPGGTLPFICGLHFFPGYHCPLCRAIFASKRGYQIHTKNETCINQCSSEHAHIPIFKQFDDIQLAKSWMAHEKIDSKFTVRDSNPDEPRYLYHCIQNVQDKREKVTQNKRKRHTKKTESCPAGFKLSKRIVCQCPEASLHSSQKCLNYTEKIIIRGCLSHSHALQVRNLRLSISDRTFILSKLRDGVPPSVILEKKSLDS